jgi:hypothetical protein
MLAPVPVAMPPDVAAALDWWQVVAAVGAVGAVIVGLAGVALQLRIWRRPNVFFHAEVSALVFATPDRRRLDHVPVTVLVRNDGEYPADVHVVALLHGKPIPGAAITPLRLLPGPESGVATGLRIEGREVPDYDSERPLRKDLTFRVTCGRRFTPGRRTWTVPHGSKVTLR